MKSLTYNRPYQYVEDLRLFACYRSKEHAVFVGQGFADNAVAFIENGPMLTKLEQQGKVVHGDFDQLITQSFDVAMPFRIYVVNPDDENGKASNAIEYTASSDTPVLDVKVDGKSVVKDQIAIIDLTGKLDVIMKPNKIYGTDADGREAQFDRQQIEGVQHFFLNGEEIPVDMGNVRLIDIAKESKTVQRVSTPLQIYGTNQDGEQATYPRDFFATSSSMDDATKEIQKLSENKQDKDKSAKDGYLAIMKNGQSVGSSGNLDDILNNIMTIQQNLDKLTQKIDKGFVKDWKALSGSDSSILNNPIGDSSIVITDKPIADEKAIRDTSNAVVYGLQPDKITDSGTAVGTRNAVGKYGVAVGTIATAKGDSAVAVGSLATASGDNSTTIGKNSSATGKGSVAIGFNSLADKDNTVSVGFDPSDSSKTPTYRRITAVDAPTNPHDAANKAYVDSNGGISEYNKSFEPFSNPYFLSSMGNIDKWKLSDATNQGLTEDNAFYSFVGLDVLDSEEVSHPSTWNPNLVGAIRINAHGDINADLESKYLRILDDDQYRMTFSIGSNDPKPSNWANSYIAVTINIKNPSGNDFKEGLFNIEPQDIVGSMKTYDITFSLKNFVSAHKELSQPYDAYIQILVISHYITGWHVFVTGTRLRNVPSQAVPTLLNSTSPISNRFLSSSMGNVDGWRYSPTGKSGTWHPASIIGNNEIIGLIPFDSNVVNYGLMRINDKEAWVIATQFAPEMYSTYRFSCQFTVNPGYPSGKSASVEIGYAFVKNDSIVPVNVKTTVGPVSTTGPSVWNTVLGTVTCNLKTVGGIVPMIHIVNPVSDGTQSTQVYISNIRIERVSLNDGTTELYHPNMPYMINGNDNKNTITRINDLAFLSIDSNFRKAMANPPDDAKPWDVMDQFDPSYPDPLPEQWRPAKGTGSIVVNCMSPNAKPFVIKIAEDGTMSATGTVNPYLGVYGSAVYPLGDFTKPQNGLPTTTGKSLPISPSSSDSQSNDVDSKPNADDSSTATPSSDTNGSESQKPTETSGASTDKSDDAQTAQATSNDAATNENTGSGQKEDDDK